MTTDTMRRKLAHRFRLFDRDGDGFLRAEDFDTLARTIVAHAVVEADSPKARAVHDGCAHYWRSLTEHADADGDGQVSEEEFVSGFGKVFTDEPDGYRRTAEPAVRAIVELCDTDGDGLVTADRFGR